MKLLILYVVKNTSLPSQNIQIYQVSSIKRSFKVIEFSVGYPVSHLEFIHQRLNYHCDWLHRICFLIELLHPLQNLRLDCFLFLNKGFDLLLIQGITHLFHVVLITFVVNLNNHDCLVLYFFFNQLIQLRQINIWKEITAIPIKIKQQYWENLIVVF